MILRLAWRNLWRHPRRTWLTCGAMIFSNLLLVFLMTLQFAMYRLMIDNTLGAGTGHIQVQSEGYLDRATMRNTLANIQQLSQQLRETFPELESAARAEAFALVSSEQRSYGVQVVGVEPEQEPRLSSLPGLMVSGRYLQASDQDAVVIGAVLARNLKASVGDELTFIGSGRDGSFAAMVVNIVGVFESGIADIDRNLAQLPLNSFDSAFAMAGSGHRVVVQVPELEQVDYWLDRIQSVPGGLPKGAAVLDWDQLQPGLKQAIQADMASAWFMYGVLVLLVAFGVLNTQLMSVLERTREFGLVLALGLRPTRLSRLVMLESALMASVGLVLGVVLGVLLILWLGYSGFSYPGMDEMASRFNLPARLYPNLSFEGVLLGPAVVFVASLMAALYPAARLLRLQPISAMRAV
ncbi:FtsX-like permease family protein [Aestuariirhabdus sp. Z084]|uniref:ABC transporter permease n=1 Tax=Aestuariirhabdus haliotis TaxID=2918751 RepID=UPI00201B412C|nr:FtsX-like permease family protein [Aestuariirhabdus haliotis]MCL6414042.1 FtsX-like permease family protein [Aestuariirhabdus haliotis]MCL6417975.1 FtsX-like permease family protein [Aestuariirhabdus haliotis]